MAVETTGSGENLMQKLALKIQDDLQSEIRKIVESEFDEIVSKVTAQVATRLFHVVEMEKHADRLVIEVRLKK